MTSFPLRVECYVSLVAILAAQYPEKTPLHGLFENNHKGKQKL